MSYLHVLESGELEVVGRLVEASNATLFARITLHDESVSAIYKPIAGERPLWDFPDGNLASREYAAFLISEWGNWHLIPQTLLRDGPFGFGAVQLWIDIDEEFELADFFSREDQQLRSLALLDAVLNNTDRKIGHLLMDSNNKLHACDHGVTFHSEDKLRTVIWQFAGMALSSEELVQLKSLLSAIESNVHALKELITSEEIAALKMRIHRLLKEETFPHPREDWPSIPWPPF